MAVSLLHCCCIMGDLKEDYYFKFVPERERADTKGIDWKSYNTMLHVILTYSALEARMSRFLSQWDLFPSAFNLLVILARTSGEGMHLSRISELLAVSRANVTGLVDVLARKNLVRRVPSPTDRRVRLAVLTPKGDKLMKEILPLYYQFNNGLCDNISEADAKAMMTGLATLRSLCAAMFGCDDELDRSQIKEHV